jgi:hypothetical protein
MKGGEQLPPAHCHSIFFGGRCQQQLRHHEMQPAKFHDITRAADAIFSDVLACVIFTASLHLIYYSEGSPPGQHELKSIRDACLVDREDAIQNAVYGLGRLWQASAGSVHRLLWVISFSFYLRPFPRGLGCNTTIIIKDGECNQYDIVTAANLLSDTLFGTADSYCFGIRAGSSPPSAIDIWT